jgi:lipid A 3-O-deacylase
MRVAAAISLAVAGAALYAKPAHAAIGPIDEVRVGVYDHDVSFLGHGKESGADLGAEILFIPLPFLWNPRPVIGGLANTDGETSQAYIGLTWTWDFAANVFTSDDGFYVEGTLGGGWNDGKLNVTDPIESQKRKSLGSHFLFREDADLGYRFNAVWSLALSYNHISNADLADRNEGLNNVGIRLGMKF